MVGNYRATKLVTSQVKSTDEQIIRIRLNLKSCMKHSEGILSLIVPQFSLEEKMKTNTKKKLTYERSKLLLTDVGCFLLIKI